MTSRRAANRYRLVLLLGLGIGLALGSFWLLQVMQKGAADQSSVARHDQPDYYVEKFNFVRMSKTGQARFNISGARMTHRPRDDSYEILLPVFHSLSPGQPPLMLRSERAIAEPDSSKIQMIDRVEADRPASADTDHFHLSTTYLVILPDEDVIQTDKPVDLHLGNAHMTGIGLYANNATREVRLAQRVRGNFPPRTAAAAAEIH